MGILLPLKELKQEDDRRHVADAVIAVHEDFPSLLRRAACVPDHRHVLHAEPELLVDLRRVDEDEGVAPDVPRKRLRESHTDRS